MPQATGRIRGVKPCIPEDRMVRVADAIRTLERHGAPFTVAEVAEIAGISRATIYRSPELKTLIGTKGDVPRPIAPEIHARLETRHASMKAKARELRSQLADTERTLEEMRERALRAEDRLRSAERKIEVLTTRRPGHGSDTSASLHALANQMGPEAMRQARRQLARALHPDLFAQDAATSALATELLKTLNALTE